VTKLVYRGPWLAERYGAIVQATGGRFDLLHPTVREILSGAHKITAPDVFRGLDRLALLHRETDKAWQEIDLLLLPTAGTTYRIAEIEADPIALNETLGRYTNFANLLDLSAIAIPAGFRRDGLPFGVTLFAPALRDPLLAAVGGALHA
jgi:allophanate hydrolase